MKFLLSIAAVLSVGWLIGRRVTWNFQQPTKSQQLATWAGYVKDTDEEQRRRLCGYDREAS